MSRRPRRRDLRRGDHIRRIGIDPTSQYEEKCAQPERGYAGDVHLSSVVKQHPIVTFFVLAYAISWGLLPFEAVRFLPSGPLLAALIVIPITQGSAGLEELGSRMIRWRVRWYWYVVALGLPLAVHATVVGLNVAAGAGVPSLAFSSLTTFLMVFAVRLVNPADGPLGEHPGWNGVALPGLQASYSPLVATMILAPLVAGWHLPIFFLEEGGFNHPFWWPAS